MFRGVSNKKVSAAIDQLVDFVGVREELPLQDARAAISARNLQHSIQLIAQQLYLPIRVNVSCVPKDFVPGYGQGFYSTALVTTDATGRASESITAQVAIPKGLPMLGSSHLDGYPVQVRVSENCWEHPDALIAVMLHELSHILLQALQSNWYNSELHVDLLPLVLGFRGAVRRGRKIVRCSTVDSITTTHTTTYGYLTDSQFEFACKRIEEILDDFQDRKKKAVSILESLSITLDAIDQHRKVFVDYLAWIDRHRPSKMKLKDAKRIVEFHAENLDKHWKARADEARKPLRAIEEFVGSLRNYTPNSIQRLDQHTAYLAASAENLVHLKKAILIDVRTLKRYVSAIYRFRRFLKQRYRRDCSS